jgi:hypothetical protein
VTSQGQRDNSAAKERDQSKELAQESVDVSQEMSKLLEGRRWDVHEGPFRGFGSPPGRF